MVLNVLVFTVLRGAWGIAQCDCILAANTTIMPLGRQLCRLDSGAPGERPQSPLVVWRGRWTLSRRRFAYLPTCDRDDETPFDPGVCSWVSTPREADSLIPQFILSKRSLGVQHG